MKEFALIVHNLINRKVSCRFSDISEERTFEELKNIIEIYYFNTYCNLDYPDWYDLSFKKFKETFGGSIPLDDVIITIYELDTLLVYELLSKKMDFSEFYKRAEMGK